MHRRRDSDGDRMRRSAHRTADEDGQGHRAAYICGQRHLWGGSHTGNRIGDKGEAVQDGGGCVDGGDIRNDSDVSLSDTIPQRHRRPHSAGDGHIHG